MRATKLEIVPLAEWDGLFRRYPSRTEAQPCHLELDCRSGTLAANHNAEIGSAVPFSVHHGHERRWGIPCLTADAANALMAEIAPLAQRVLDGYESRWDGSNVVARLSDDAQAAEAEIEKTLEGLWDDANVVSAVDVGDWLQDVPDELTANTTDDQLEALASTLEAEAAEHLIVLRGTLGWLSDQRQALRDAHEES